MRLDIEIQTDTKQGSFSASVATGEQLSVTLRAAEGALPAGGYAVNVYDESWNLLAEATSVTRQSSDGSVTCELDLSTDACIALFADETVKRTASVYWTCWNTTENVLLLRALDNIMYNPHAT